VQNLACGMEGHRRTEKDLTGPSSPSARAGNQSRRIEVIKEDFDSDSGRSSLCLVNEHIQRNILVCALCKQLYSQPKLLPCLHTYCTACLWNFTPSSSLTISCPDCGHTSILPPEGISGLQSNTFLASLMTMINGEDVAGQKDEFEETDILTNSSGHSSISTEHGEQDIISCSKHNGQQLRFYCLHCETAVCSSCTDIEHRDHQTVGLDIAMKKEKETMRTTVSNILEKVPNIKSSIEDIKSTNESLLTKEEDLDDTINDRFDQLVAMIEQRRTCLLNQLHFRVSSKREKLESQLKDLEENLADVLTSCEFVDRAIDNASSTQLLLVKKQVGEGLKNSSNCEASLPIDTDYVELSWDGLDAAKETINSIGTLISSSCIPSLSSAGGEGLRKTLTGRKSSISLTTRDCSGNMTPGPSLSQITCQIEAVGGIKAGTLPRLIQVQVLPGESGEYDIVYSLPKEGRYRMWIRLFGQDIQDSPFQITCLPDEDTRRSVRSYSASLPRPSNRIRSRRSTPGSRPMSANSWNSLGSSRNAMDDDLIIAIGSRGRGKGEFTNPQGVAVTVSGDILVCDSNSQCVQVFSPTGALLSKWGVRGRSPGQLQRPTGIAVMKDGKIAVSDYDNKWISVHEPSGKFVSKFGGNRLLGPKGLTVAQTGELVVVDNKASCVYILQPSGKVLSKFGTRGSEAAQFAGPHYAAINSHANIIISDFHNHNIKVFTKDGHFIFSFGSNGEGNGQFNAPTGVAVDTQDNILVADWGNSRIQVFDQYGSFLSYVNTSGCPLYGPQGIALTVDGNIVVADSGNHCIKIYKYLQ